MRPFPVCLALLFSLTYLLAFSKECSTSTRNTFSSPVDSLQDAKQSLNGISDHTLQVLNNRYALMNKLVERQTEKMLKRMEKKELTLQSRLQGKLHGVDSMKAQALFTGTQAR